MWTSPSYQSGNQHNDYCGQLVHYCPHRPINKLNTRNFNITRLEAIALVAAVPKVSAPTEQGARALTILAPKPWEQIQLKPHCPNTPDRGRGQNNPCYSPAPSSICARHRSSQPIKPAEERAPPPANLSGDGSYRQARARPRAAVGPGAKSGRKCRGGGKDRIHRKRRGAETSAHLPLCGSGVWTLVVAACSGRMARSAEKSS